MNYLPWIINYLIKQGSSNKVMWDDLGNIQSVTSLHGWMRLKPIVDLVIT